MLKSLVCMFFLCAASFAASQDDGEVVLNQERQMLQIDFSKTYVTYLNLDIETMVELPDGYKFTAAIPGSRDFVSVSPIQNTLYMTKITDEAFQTNLVCHVVTSEGIEQKLLFRLVAQKGSPKILGIQFQNPNTSELNRTIEAIKTRYAEQLSASLAQQEKDLKESVHDTSIIAARTLWIQKHRGRVRVSEKGASAYVDGMINSRGKTYISIRTPIKKDACDIVKLLKAGPRKNPYDAELVKIADSDGAFVYTYSIPELPIQEKKFGKFKRNKVKFVFSIWSIETSTSTWYR